MRQLHVLVPDGIDDPDRPSGGNRFDRLVLKGLAADGWDLQEHEVSGTWDGDPARAGAAVESILASIPERAVLLVDSLVATQAAVRLAVRARSAPVALLVHTPFPDMDPVLGVAAAVIVTSNWTRDRFVGAGVSARRLHVAVPGADPAPLAIGSSNAGSLLTVGAVVPGKGYDVLLDALEFLDDLDWHATWVGPLDRDVEFVASLRSRIGSSWLSDRIELVGPLADPGPAYEKADLLVHPTRAESFGLVVTEALARGLPVVASRVGGVPEALGRVGRGELPGQLIPAADARALSGALRRWLAEPWWQARLRAAARVRRSELRPWPDTVDAVAGVLESLVPDIVA
jgi:glycosyltransferase involved in cell wall biosynthesis